MDTGPEAVFDRVANLAARLIGVPVATITFVDGDRQWYKAAVGVPLMEMPRGVSFCAHTILGTEPLVVPDLRLDPRFADNPLVAGAPHARFYAGVPLHDDDGHNLGTLCAIDLEARELAPAQLAILEDLAEIAMDALRYRRAMNEKNDLMAAIENIDAGVVVTDSLAPDAPIIFSNAAFDRITGYSAADFLGKNCRFLQGPGTDAATIERLRDAVKHQRAFHGILLNYRKDGTPFWNELTVTPVTDDTGRAIRLVAIQSDVTRRKEADDQLRENFERLRELETLRDNLTHMIVHDMRSPLTVGMGSIQLMQMAKENRSTSDRELLAEANGALLELNRMVTSLLDVSRLESGDMPVDLVVQDLGELVRSALSRGRSIAGPRISEHLPAAPVLVRCDTALMTRVIDNLVGNALKFTEATGRVEVVVARTGDTVRLSVCDSGPGVAPEHREIIFQKFGQVAATRTEHSSGLGLAFCKLAVEAQGGAIGLDSETSVGSTFWVTLAAAIAPEGAASS